MLRLSIRYVTMYLNPAKFGKKTNVLTRHISSSFGCMKCIQSTDDYYDTPTYCEGQRQLTKRLSKDRFTDYLEQNLFCASERAAEICLMHPEFRERNLKDVKKNVDFLTQEGVSRASIVDSAWTLTLAYDSLCSRLRIVQDMKPINIEDFVPLAINPQTKLIKIAKFAEKDKGIVPSEHRIYHFSKLLDMPPYTISKYVSKRLFMLEMPFKIVDERLKILLQYKTPQRIVTNLWPIKNATDLVESRLAQVKQLNMSETTSVYKSKKSWELSVKKPHEIRNLLDGRSLEQYLSDRLYSDINAIETMLEIHPILRKMNLIMIDEKLDYLLYEAGIQASEIVLFPNVLRMSMELMKKRIQELQLHGCPHSCILNVVCYSANLYSKWLSNFKENSEKTGL